MATPNQYRKDTVMMSLRLPAALKAALAELAVRRGTSVNRLIRDTLAQMLATAGPTPMGGELSGQVAERRLQHLRATVQAHRIAMTRRRRLAQQLSLQVADMLRRRFGVAEVRLVGSMSRLDAPIGPDSDIDLLVSGLPANNLVAATTAARSVCRDLLLVDLIRREDLSEVAARLFFGQEGAGDDG